MCTFLILKGHFEFHEKLNTGNNSTVDLIVNVIKKTPLLLNIVKKSIKVILYQNLPIHIYESLSINLN